VYVEQRGIRKPTPANCLGDLEVLLAGLAEDLPRLSELTRHAYFSWAADYLGQRFSHNQARERLAQEKELTAFLRRTEFQAEVTISPVLRKRWITVARDLFDLGEDVFLTELKGHIMRYGLLPYEAGQVLVALAQSFQYSPSQGTLEPIADLVSN